MTAASLISFDHVSFSYQNKQIFSNLSFSIKEGQWVCLLGANGSGKSTIARLIDALILPGEGTVTVAGYDTSNPASHMALRSLVGMVFQNPDDQLVATLVEDDVAFGLENTGLENPELRMRVTHALDAVGLAGYETKSTNSLSGGQKQRVALAGALALCPRLLILDEASSMLDSQGRAMLLKICKTLHQQGVTIIMITHFIDDALDADRVMVLDKGSLVLDGEPRTILGNVESLTSRGLVAPFACRLSQELCSRGISLHPTLTTLELQEALCCWSANR